MMLHYPNHDIRRHTQRARNASIRVKPTTEPLRFWVSSGSIDGHWWPVEVSDDLQSADCGCPAILPCRHGAPCIVIARRNAELAAWDSLTARIDTIAA